LTGWQEPDVLNRRRGLFNDKAAGRARSYRVGNRSGRINAFPRDPMRISIQGLLGCAKGAAAQLDPDPARHGRDCRQLRDEPKLPDYPACMLPLCGLLALINRRLQRAGNGGT